MSITPFLLRYLCGLMQFSFLFWIWFSSCGCYNICCTLLWFYEYKRGTVRKRRCDVQRGNKDIGRTNKLTLLLLHLKFFVYLFFRSVYCIHNGIHHSFVLFLGVFRGALLDGRMCIVIHPGFRTNKKHPHVFTLSVVLQACSRENPTAVKDFTPVSLAASHTWAQLSPSDVRSWIQVVHLGNNF